MIQITIADYVTSLLTFDETKVLIGRDNASIEIFSDNYIVIDVLHNNNFSNGSDYNSDTEVMKYNSVMSGTFTLEFYGKDGYDNVYKFINMSRSQLSSDLQKQHSITVYKPKGINDLKQIVGNKYFDRYEVEIVVQYNQSLDIEALRIVEIPTSIIGE